MNTSKQLFHAAETIKALTDKETNEIAKQALADAQSKLVLQAADQLIWEIEQAKK